MLVQNLVVVVREPLPLVLELVLLHPLHLHLHLLAVAEVVVEEDRVALVRLHGRREVRWQVLPRGR